MNTVKVLGYFAPGADYSLGVVSAFWMSHKEASRMSFGGFCDFLQTVGGVHII